MGCKPSKLHRDDTVRRCKDRRCLIKEAVYARHHLAAAHSDYCRSLRITGSALVTFAFGEPFSASDHREPFAAASKPPPTTFRTTFPSPSPSTRTTPMSTSSSRHYQKPPPPPRRGKPIKLPHILSDSSLCSSPPPGYDFSYNAAANSTYSNTPSQTSSIWNWENFYPPPSPPDSEYFDRFHRKKNSETRTDNRNPQFDHTDSDNDDDPSIGAKQFDDRASSYSPNSVYSNSIHKKNYTKEDPIPPLRLSQKQLKYWESEEDEPEREEVHCSEWGDHDHYSTTTSSSDEGEEPKSRSDYAPKSNYESKKNQPTSAAASNWGNMNPKSPNKSDDDGARSWRNGNNESENSDLRIVLRHKDLVEIVAALRENFDKAASAGEHVSEMLETGRAQLDRNFKQLKKTIYHSSGMLSSLSSTWTSKPPLAVRYQLEPIEHPGGPKSLCSTLERLLAWEKKLYQEVKSREGVKMEHEKKLSVLQSQEYRGEDEAKLDKTKASIKRLQSLVVVTSQAVATTSSAIVGLRDSDLVPQLVDLCHGLMYMWRSMNQSHELQNDVVQQVRSLVNRSRRGESTTDAHHQATCELESAISAWHSSFCRVIKFQRDFVRALYGWFKLTVQPVHNEQTIASKEPSEVLAFFDEWRLALDRIPDTVASEAIKSFNNIVHSVWLKQTEEQKIKKRTEAASKELQKRAASLSNIEKKYYNSYSLVGAELPNTGSDDNAHILDARDPLADKKAELTAFQRRVEDEILKHKKAIEVTRAMTLNNIQTGLPGVFQAMMSFSAMITEALETVCTRSYAIQ